MTDSEIVATRLTTHFTLSFLCLPRVMISPWVVFVATTGASTGFFLKEALWFQGVARQQH